MFFDRGTYSSQGYYIQLTGTAAVTFAINRSGSATTYFTVSGSNFYTASEWNHIVFVRNGTITIKGRLLFFLLRHRGLLAFLIKHTKLGNMQVGDLVNLEVDIIAKYVEQLSQVHNKGVTVDFLEEHGFLAN